MNPDDYEWQPMKLEHVDLIVERERQSFDAELWEGRELYEPRFLAHPHLHFVLAHRHSGAVAGHALMLPIERGRPPLIRQPPAPAPPAGVSASVYLYDVFLEPPLRGKGFLSKLLALLPLESTTLELIGVHGADAVWKRYGFVPVASEISIACYGSDAVYMRRDPGPLAK